MSKISQTKSDLTFVVPCIVSTTAVTAPFGQRGVRLRTRGWVLTGTTSVIAVLRCKSIE